MRIMTYKRTAPYTTLVGHFQRFKGLCITNLSNRVNRRSRNFLCIALRQNSLLMAIR